MHAFLFTSADFTDPESPGVLIELDDDSDSEQVTPYTEIQPYTDAVHCQKPTKHIKRPMNAFMIWAQKERKKIAETNPELHNSIISKMLGERWKQLDEQYRQQYYAQAVDLRELHRRQYPNYRFVRKRKTGKVKEKIYQGLVVKN